MVHKNCWDYFNIIGSNIEIISDESRIRPEKSEVNRLIADNSKIKSLTTWEDQIAFRDGLEKTVNWIEKIWIISISMIMQNNIIDIIKRPKFLGVKFITILLLVFRLYNYLLF